MQRTTKDPKIRLAYHPTGKCIERSLSAPPTIRLAHIDGAQGDGVLRGKNGVTRIPDESAPALLISFVYLKAFIAHQQDYVYRDWVLDSGAFSAHNSGTPVDIDQFIETSKHLLKTDESLTEVYALDVIGDHKGTLKNTEKMWKAGVPAIPTYHPGEPTDYLLHIAKNYPKIALGGVARKPQKWRLSWIAQCFARVWPKKIHGFGMCSEPICLGFPFHSVDSTSWEMGPCGFGNWRTFGKMSLRGSSQNLRAEIEWHLKLERQAQSRWKKEMQLLESTTKNPKVRLAVVSDRARRALSTDEE